MQMSWVAPDIEIRNAYHSNALDVEGPNAGSGNGLVARDSGAEPVLAEQLSKHA